MLWRTARVHTYNWIPGVEVIDGAKATPLKKV